ncbi:flagellar biosynthesis anti-sigma factor FlgM [Clostridium aceticum]|uniref:Negative regulator of flagellin synthesis n=1 Tax=Clostridium aceticum TaxID=84022 RepID=A0A0D8I6Y7_9CLOT|nr:flagellar biosynthesis anti-sigma factor FlgM [Clostridium aceticum]AKL93768.1 flagellar biosynthesis anti-sigma factor FlgM [Clostridium aceticum]KJF25807.1 flagellar biosynthesis anti-sigma factor FlgM [Clostridium aceticum]
MKIYNSSNINKVMKLYNKAQQGTEKTLETGEKKDKIEISQKAKEFQVAMKALKNLPEVRQEKVKELRESIENNSYNVSGKEIADKIIEGIMIDKKI